MVETFFEETVVDENPKGVKGKSSIFNTLKIVSIVLAVLFAIVGLLGSQIPEEPYIDFKVLIFFLLFTVFFVILFFFFKKKRMSLSSSYDYTFVSGSLRISRIMRNIKRKNLVNIECETITAMDKISHDSFNRYQSQKGIKIIIATPNLENAEDNLYYAYYSQDNINKLMIFQPSDTLLVHIKRNSRALRTAR